MDTDARRPNREQGRDPRSDRFEVRRWSLEELAHELRRRDRAEPLRLADLRGSAAHRRAHPVGAASLPASLLPSSLHLLPPRTRPLVLIAGRPVEAEHWARWCAGRGWSRAGWLDGSPGDLDPSVLCPGRDEPHRIWEPAPLLLRHGRELPPQGPACDLACGSGRNAVYLALGGREVLGVDILPDALRQARSLARASAIGRRGGVVRFQRRDLTDAAAAASLLRPCRFRVLTCFRYLDRGLLPLMQSALVPGGWLLFETFLEEQARAKGRPRRSEHLLRPGELKRAFQALDLIDYREGEDEEGNWLASLAGRKPID